jgi:S1-C subfamily serine protease
MRKALPVFVTATLLSIISANAQQSVTSKAIYRTNHSAVVQIYVNEQFSGDGFLVSSDGSVLTANHVVATRESHFREYFPNIKVMVFSGNAFKVYPAVPLLDPNISADQANFDYAFLKITGGEFPHVTLGGWSEIDIGSSLVVITSFPGVGPSMMLEGTVSGKSQGLNPDFGPKPFDTLLFQCPVRKGFSGAPIFSSNGTVVGIVDTEVFGISPALDEQRKKWASLRGPDAPVNVTVKFGGADLGDSVLELTNNLDRNLISGLGGAMAIGYAKEQTKPAHPKTKP